MRFSSRSRSSRPALAALVVAALIAPGAPFGQATFETGLDDPTGKKSSFIERSRVELALIEAVVTDHKGRHVRNLPASAFQLLAGGDEVEIVSFDEIDLTSADKTAEVVTASPPSSAAPAPDDPTETTEASVETRAVDDSGPAAAQGDEPAPLLEPESRKLIEAKLQGDRWFIMVFDGYNNVSPRRMSQARNASKKWVDKNMRERDMVAVFELNPFLSSVSGFTNETLRLKEAIDDVRIFPGSSIGHEMLEQTLEQARVYSRDYLEEKLLNVSRFGTDLIRAEQDQFYVDFLNLSEVMAGLEGTKAVLLFSGGFPLTRTRSTNASGGFTPRFKSMIEKLEAQGIRVFTYDAGEDGGFTDASEATNYRNSLEELGFGTEWLDDLQVGAQIDAANAHQEILSVLGGETGGRFWRGTDYAAGLQAADDDLSHYYLIGYRPLMRDRKGRSYLKMKLKVTGERKMRVISRRGNFAQLDPAATTAAADFEDLSTTDTATENPVGAPIDLSCRPLFYPMDGMRTLAVLPIEVSGPITGVPMGAGEYAIDMDLTVNATMAGETIDTSKRNIRLKFPESALAQLANGAQIREAIALPPSVLDLEISLRINGQNRSGDWNSRVTVPIREGRGFGLTDLGLLDATARAPLVYDVFLKGDSVTGIVPPAKASDPLGADAKGRPPMYVAGGFSRKVPLLAHVQITDPPAPSAELPSPLSMDWELIPAGGGDAIAPPVQYRRLQVVDGGKRLDVLIDLDLAAVPPGDYELRLTAQNLVDQSRDERSRSLSVVP